MKALKQILASTILLSSAAVAADFLAPFTHLHASQNGTPYVHSFGIEPASTGRDLFIDHTYINGDGFTEHETEFELEWAFTKRLGMIVEVPYIYEDVEGVATSSGFGDLAIVPRILLVEQEHFLLTTQLEVALPTGSSSFGGDTSIAPGIAMWNDLGNNFTLNSYIGLEHGFDANETELAYGLGLVKSFSGNQANKIKDPCHDDDYGHSHTSHTRALNLHLEITGSAPVNGPDDGDINLEALLGISYSIIADLDIRAGYFIPLTYPNDFSQGFTTGMIFHF